MKKHLDLGLGFLTALSLNLATTAPIYDLSNLPQLPATSEAYPSRSVSLISQRFGGQTPPSSTPSSNPSSVDGKTWMSGENIPWSTPVLVRDRQKGDYLAVFDRNYPTGMNVKQVRQMGEISNWSLQSIGIYGYGVQKHCVVVIFVPVCDTKHPIYPVSAAALKIGSKVFNLRGGDSQFIVDDELAYALRSAYPQKVLLRLTLAGGSQSATHLIGEPTVKAWQVIYQKASQPVVQSPETLPSPAGTVTVPISIPPELVATLPVVDGATWRINDDLPWSMPALVKDEFDGEYVAVFDRDYQKNEWNANESGLVSNWSQKDIWLHIYEIVSGTSYRTFAVDAAEIKVGDRTFHLTSRNNHLDVTDELAQALHNAIPGKVEVSFVNPEGKTVTHRIGDKTINAWKTVYPTSSLPPPVPTVGPSQ